VVRRVNYAITPTTSVSTLTPVSSSAIAAVGYDGHSLKVVFRGSGRAYTHPNVPRSVYVGLMQASSKGEYYNKFIRGRYR